MQWYDDAVVHGLPVASAVPHGPADATTVETATAVDDGLCRMTAFSDYRRSVRRYRGFMVDSARWERFEFRTDDIVITTPSKCGTTWLQNIVGMLVLGRADLGEPLSLISPWLDMLNRSEDEVFGLLERQHHRRFIKTHTPLDGIPFHGSVTYLTIVRHPLDAALSNHDHAANAIAERVVEARLAVGGDIERSSREVPTDPAEMLLWFIDHDEQPTGSGPYGLSDLCHQVRTYWSERHRPNVHLFHYSDLWDDLDGEMRRVARILGVEPDQPWWAEVVAAATLDSMRSRADRTAPEAHREWWRSAADFFASGGTRSWRLLLGDSELDHFDRRLRQLAGDASDWVLRGREALDAVDAVDAVDGV